MRRQTDRRWAAGLAFLVSALPAAAQDGDAAVAGATCEPGLMALVVTAIVIVGGLIWQLLIRSGRARRGLWILPILILLTGVAWAVVQTVGLDHMKNLNSLLIFLFSFLIFVSLLYPVTRLLLPSRLVRTRGGVPPLLRGVAIAIVVFIGLFVLLSWAFPDLNLTPMFVTSGVVSLVIGFALQDLLGNLMAGIVLSVERPFRVGDWVKVGEREDAEVVEQMWRATRVRTRQNDYVLIPNNVMAREQVRNYAQPTADHMHRVFVGISYATPCGIVIQALKEAAGEVEEVLQHPAPEVHLRDFTDSSLLYELRVWIDNYASLPAIDSEVRQHVWYSLKRYGLTIPFPQRDVNFRRAVEPEMREACRLVVSSGPLRGAMFPLAEEPVRIGRSPESDVCISDRQVSAQHAVVELKEGHYVLKDLDSRHGTEVNGLSVTEVALRQGDEVSIGPVAMIFETAAVPTWTATSRRATLADGQRSGRDRTAGDTTGTSDGTSTGQTG